MFVGNIYLPFPLKIRCVFDLVVFSIKIRKIFRNLIHCSTFATSIWQQLIIIINIKTFYCDTSLAVLRESSYAGRTSVLKLGTRKTKPHVAIGRCIRRLKKGKSKKNTLADAPMALHKTYPSNPLHTHEQHRHKCCHLNTETVNIF